MRVFVVGHQGMLGHVAARYLRHNGLEVVTSSQRYQALPRDPLVDEIRASRCPWVINALGIIKQKCDQSDALFRANSLFPLQVKQWMHSDQRLIHASTDCVFSGRLGNYSVESEPDPVDEYGLSKVLGEYVAEAGRCTVLRTSIIGPERAGSHFGLMAWFLEQRGAVQGFTNHLWNGITTLDWSKACLEIIRGNEYSQRPLLQLGIWPPISKHDLLSSIAEVWNHRVSIEPYEAPVAIDRSLQPTWLRPPMSAQLVDLRQWYLDELGS